MFSTVMWLLFSLLLLFFFIFLSFLSFSAHIDDYYILILLGWCCFCFPSSVRAVHTQHISLDFLSNAFWRQCIVQLLWLILSTSDYVVCNFPVAFDGELSVVCCVSKCACHSVEVNGLKTIARRQSNVKKVTNHQNDT